jgi:HK97 family phage major capsid protein
MRIRMTAALVEASEDASTITGLLIPFHDAASPSVGPAVVRFDADGMHSFADRVWLNEEHEETRRLGFARSTHVDADGIWATFTILPTQRGRDAIIEANSAARDGLSVEAEIVLHEDIDGITVVKASTITGAALTMRPAFTSARVTVAATEAEPEPADSDPADPGTEETEREDMTVDPPIYASNRLPSAGEYILAAAKGDLAGITQMIRAAAPHTLSTDVAGLIPDPIVGGLMKQYVAESPLFDALGNRTAPNTNSFQVPLVTTRVEPAAAAAEKSDVTKQLVIGSVQVDMVALKRAINLSEEAILYSQLDLLSIAAEQLTEAVISGREKVAADAITAATSQNAKVTIALNGSDAWSKLANATAVAFAATGSRPNLAALDPTTWAKLAGFTNTNGAPLIGGMNQNLDGSNGTLFGLPVVVSPSLTKSYLVDKRLVGSWSNGNIRMRVDEPTILGRALGALHSVGISVASGKGLTEIAVATS